MDAQTYIILATVCAMLFDIVSGIAKACKQGNMSSTKLREGGWHKMGFAGLIALGFLLQFAAGYADLGVEIPAVGAICIYIITTEAVSIFENLSVLNPDIAASPLGRILDVNKEKEE